ncbi:MAG TPA: hypothetical protein VMC85_20800 [Desulfomonilaceae bacterium]|nr:hypothetical protein [Desulfomonilaceae bacterium]
MIDPGAGILDSFTKIGKRPKVNVSAFFLPETKIVVKRPCGTGGKDWKILAHLEVKEVCLDEHGDFTNELIFTEPLPKEVRRGDLIALECSPTQL